jgi:hypothetical protein
VSKLTQKKNHFTIVAALAAVAIGLLYFNQCFFFGPFSHKRYTVAHLPWTWYKNPLQLEYGVLDDEGWKFTKVTNKDEIMKVFAELSRCTEISVGEGLSQPGDGAPVWFGIRRLSDGLVLLSAEGLENNPYFHVRDLATLCLTPELQSLIEARLKQARILPPIN